MSAAIVAFMALVLIIFKQEIETGEETNSCEEYTKGAPSMPISMHIQNRKTERHKECYYKNCQGYKHALFHKMDLFMQKQK